MAGRCTEPIEFWRSFFRESEHDLWTIVDKALTVAALDFPDKLRTRRDGYAEKLFSRPVPDVFGSQGAEEVEDEAEEEEEEGGTETGDVEDMRSGNRDVVASSSGKVDELEMKEVLAEMKMFLLDHDKTDADVLECLNKLAIFQLSIETLKATGIGKPVNALRKHSSVQIRSLAKKLVRSWKALADEWAKSLDDVQVSEPGETNDEDFGLQEPPVDEGELLAALEMRPQFMDFMDNELASSDLINTTDESPLVQVSYTSSRASHSPPYNDVGRRHGERERRRRVPETPPPSERLKDRMAAKRTTTTQNLSQKLPVEEYSIKDRLAAAKRRLQEGYQQAETAKKQRTVQVMDLQDLPKGSGPKAARPGSAKPAHNNNNNSHSNNRPFQARRW